jgi:hypothetical protein
MEFNWKQFEIEGSWGDYQMEEEMRVNSRWLGMADEKWEDYARRQIRYAKNVNAAMRWVDRMSNMRKTHFHPQPKCESSPIKRVQHEPLHTKFLVLQDMVDEPWKYGDDVCETLALEEELMKTPKAWRVHAMWINWAEEEKEEQNKYQEIRSMSALIKFQALVRGHQTRCRNGWTSCAHCLCHRVSTWWAGDEERPVCEECYNQIRQNLRQYKSFDAPMF